MTAYEAFLRELLEREGRLTPLLVLEAARREDSPIHGYVFNRDPTDAAEQYYLARAHKLIQFVRVAVTRADGQTRVVRVFHNVPSASDASSYEPLETLVHQPTKHEVALNSARRRVEEAQDSVEDLLFLSSDAGPSRARTHLQRARKALG